MEYYAAIEYCLVFLKHKEMFLKWKKKSHHSHSRATILKQQQQLWNISLKKKKKANCLRVKGRIDFKHLYSSFSWFWIYWLASLSIRLHICKMEGYFFHHSFLTGLWENIDTSVEVIIISIISAISSLQILICFQNTSHLKWKPFVSYSES